MPSRAARATPGLVLVRLSLGGFLDRILHRAIELATALEPGAAIRLPYSIT
jgi:hypothetical protein